MSDVDSPRFAMCGLVKSFRTGFSGLIVLPLVLLLFAAVSVVWAQDSLATVTGTVTDTTNSVVPRAKVRATNTATGEGKTATSNESGIFVIPMLKPGLYELRVEAAGFKEYKQSGIVLETGARTRLDAKLEVGALNETVTVAAAAPLLESESSSVATVVENRSIANMPLIDRRAAQLAKLSGFVSSGLPTGGSNNNSAFSIAGGRADDNSWYVDGGVVQNSTVDTPGLFFDPPIESLQEFNVSISTFAAELGRSGGGVILMTTKSGTNQFHGSVYEYLRNDALDARSFFAATKPKLRYNLFGASLGGPVIKNKLHFFFNYEGIRSKSATTVLANLPTPLEVTGDFSKSTVTIKDPAAAGTPPFPGNVIPANRLDPVGLAIASLYPAPNVPGRPSGSSNYRTNSLVTSPQNIWLTRIDYTLSESDRIYGRFMYRTNPQTTGPIFPQPGIDSNNQIVNTSAYDVVATWSHNFSPTWINEVRFNRDSRVASQWHGGLDQGWPAKLGLKGTNPRFFPNVTVTGLQSMGNASRQYRSQDPTMSNYFVDNITKIHGSHTFKGGIEYRFSSNVDIFDGTAGGAFSFTNTATGSGLATLLLGWVTSASRQEDLPLSARAPSMGVYFQDDWKVSKRLTLNLGVRWDYDKPRYESFDNRQSGFDAGAINPVSGTPGIITFSGRNGVPSLSANSDLNNFGPRVGFAWQPGDKWVVRGGAGMLYLGQYTNNVTFDPSLGFSLQGSFVSPDSGLTPAFLLKNGMPPLSYPAESDLKPGFGSVAVGQSPTTSVLFLDRGRRNGYLESFSASVQRQIGKNWLTEIGYVGTLGHKLPGASSESINQVAPNLMGPGNAQVRRPFPQFSNVSVLAPAIGNSNYHGMNLKLEKRYSMGLHFTANYTWSRLIDDISARVELGGYPGSGFMDYYNRRANRGLSGNDMAHRLVFSSVYELPFGAGKQFNPGNKVVRQVVGGWSFGYIAELHTGSPFGVVEQTNTTNAFSDSQRPNVVGNPNLPSGRTRAQQVAQWFNTAAFAAPAAYTFGNSGKTVAYGPGAINMDVSILRDFRFLERHQIEFRCEMLNFINRPNFGIPVTSRGNANFGSITSLVPGNQNRIVQFGLRYSF